MIPELVEMPGSPWTVLPVGVHPADLRAIADAFAVNPQRKSLFDGLVEGAHDLASAGCRRIYVDGSYVTNKPIPGDYDVCWEPEGVDVGLLDRVFLDFSKGRAAQKAKYGGEFFPSCAEADHAGSSFLEFFQLERHSGARKGIVLVELVCDPMIQGEVTT